MESKILTGNNFLCPAETFKFYPVGKKNQQVLVTRGWCLHILYYHPYSTSLTCYSFKIRQPFLQKPINYLRHKKCTECNRMMTSACPSQLKKKISTVSITLPLLRYKFSPESSVYQSILYFPHIFTAYNVYKYNHLEIVFLLCLPYYHICDTDPSNVSTFIDI